MNLEKYHFFCEHCSAQLDSEGSIHLTTKRQNGNKGLIHLSTNFGTYSYKHEPETIFDEDELIQFFCPSCQTELKSEGYPEFSQMTMRAESKFDFEILFSRKAGMHKTYIITEDGIESYGKDSAGEIG